MWHPFVVVDQKAFGPSVCQCNKILMIELVTHDHRRNPVHWSLGACLVERRIVYVRGRTRSLRTRRDCAPTSALLSNKKNREIGIELQLRSLQKGGVLLLDGGLLPVAVQVRGRNLCVLLCFLRCDQGQGPRPQN